MFPSILRSESIDVGAGLGRESSAPRAGERNDGKYLAGQGHREEILCAFGGVYERPVIVSTQRLNRIVLRLKSRRSSELDRLHGEPQHHRVESVLRAIVLDSRKLRPLRRLVDDAVEWPLSDDESDKNHHSLPFLNPSPSGSHRIASHLTQHNTTQHSTEAPQNTARYDTAESSRLRMCTPLACRPRGYKQVATTAREGGEGSC